MKIVDFIEDLGKVISFSPELARCVGRNEAILLNQLIWWRKDLDCEEWVCKSMQEIEEATSLTRWEQRAAREGLREKGILHERTSKRDHKMYYRIDRNTAHRVWKLWKAGKENTPGGQVRKPNLAGKETSLDARAHYARARGIQDTNNKIVTRSARHAGFFGSDLPETFEEIAAHKLEQHIRETRQLCRTPNRKKWVKAMQELLEDINLDKPRLKRVLIWYIKNWNLDKMLEIHSAEQFREKFTRLESRMGKERKGAPTPIKEFEYTAKEKELFAYLKDMGWPKGSASSLLECIHLSLESYGVWYKRVQKTKANDATPQKVRVFIDDLQYSVTNSPHSFIRHWFEHVAKRVRTWKDWNGDLRYYIFSVEHKEFMNMGLAEATRYTGPSSAGALWELLLKTVNEN